MNCPICNCCELSSSEAYDFAEDFYSLYQVHIPENLPLYKCYNQNFYELAKKISLVFFAYRGESINLIAKETSTCKCSVIFSLSAISNQPEMEFNQLIESPVLYKFKLEEVSVSELDSYEAIYKIKLNSIFQELEESSDSSLRDILNFCRLRLVDFRLILKDYLGMKIDNLFLPIDEPLAEGFLRELTKSFAWIEYEEMKKFI